MKNLGRNLLPTGVLALLLAGDACAPRANAFTDMPQARPIPTARSVDDVSTPPEQRTNADVMRPVRRPTDAVVTAREPYPRLESRLNAVLTRLDPGAAIDWSLLGIAILF